MNNVKERERTSISINTGTNKENQNKEKSKNKNNSRKTYRPRRKGFVTKRTSTPKDSVKVAFSTNNDAKNLFKKTIHEYAHGRHILELSPLDIYELQNGLFARKRALVNIMKVNPTLTVHIQELSPRLTYELSDFAYEELYKGLTKILSELSLNCYVSPEKIINAGNVIKNHNGIITYGGKTIRDYLTHMIRNEKIKDINDEDKTKCYNIIKQCRKTFSEYNTIKSLPFSIFRYRRYIKTDEDGNILSPDIEAKYNLKRVIGISNYSSAPFAQLSVSDATILESKVIEKIRKTAQAEADKNMDNLLPNISDPVIKEHLKLASNLDNVSLITNHGHIHDILDYMIENTMTIIKLEQEPTRKISEEEAQKIIKIEYAAAQGNYDTDISKDIVWIADLGESLKGKFANYEIIKRIIALRFTPQIDGVIITNFNINLVEFDAILDASKDMPEEEKIEFINENLKTLYL